LDDLQLGVRIILGCEAERIDQELLPNGVVPHRLTVCSVLVESLVNHIPAGAAALIATCKVLDVVLHDIDELSLAEVASSHPWRQLTMPDQIVAVDLVAVSGGEVDIFVGVREGKVALLWLGRLPFLSIFRCDAAECQFRDPGLLTDSTHELKSTLLL
jgi:hypothetical protein